ncbi:MAG: cysteine--tRNA ligase [Sporocytophaga sp.]|uniref:cysteine--tRNA ligase n=1 Tax=Sporocytophaga sp. TaxID=2231183 RepID=UPI001B2C8AE5|nr:cysteine--tRNA ligase [Sporocytophaga sp.]MBO9702313.1 cysteine--tRNA ligase [Sporocytophaga sp.]
MNKDLKIYNTLSREKEVFEPILAPYVGMYVCGPTVYGDPHLGHSRAAITFDIVFRYLQFLGFKVRYVRNITDVGHLENDADEGEDKIAKKAKLEQLEPMEVVQHYTDAYHRIMNRMNVLSPSIEPHASGHILEQIDLTEKIIDSGFGYVVDGSVYFDVVKYSKSNHYGKLSGRVIEDLITGTRELDGSGKANALDFALWKKASPEHIMKWQSPWGEGFPGWHIECSAMSTKYLGKHFDIHGGGMDLMFPHHECEIAQATAGNHAEPAKYWMHNNMITINGQKMGKSLGNFITMDELFSGKHTLLKQAYTPMTIRFFILQAHYRSTLDFSNEALIAAQKGYKKLLNGLKLVKYLNQNPEVSEPCNEALDLELKKLSEACFEGLNDDFNTAITIASLFNLLKKINGFQTGALNINQISSETLSKVKDTFINITENILGLLEEGINENESLIEGLLEFYKDAKSIKDYEKVDKIRKYFKEAGLVIRDSKNSIDWAYEE